MSCLIHVTLALLDAKYLTLFFTKSPPTFIYFHIEDRQLELLQCSSLGD